MKSPRTTATGVLMIISAIIGATIVFLKTGTLDAASMALALGNISGGIGLITARDNNVTSEQAGAK